MNINDLEKNNARNIETIKRKQFRVLNRLDQDHQSIKEEIKKNHENNMVELESENHRQLVTESEKKEKILGQMKKNLDETQKITDKQIKDLKQKTVHIQEQEHEKQSLTRDQLKADQEMHLEDLNHRFSTTQNRIVAENQNELNKLKEVHHQEITGTREEFANKLTEQKHEFQQRINTDSTQNQKMKDTLDRQFKKDRLATNVRQQVELNKMTSSHHQALEASDSQFRKGVKEQGLVFETKYAEELKNKNEALSRLDHLNKKIETKMKDDLKEQLQASVNRSDDPFYRFTELKPTMKQFENHIEISVEVPDHAKRDLQLTLNNKEAVLSFNRRYDDTRKLEGVTNKLHKVESFTTRINTNQHLDPKSIKAVYENGVMTYIVKKA